MIIRKTREKSREYLWPAPINERGSFAYKPWWQSAAVYGIACIILISLILGKIPNLPNNLNINLPPVMDEAASLPIDDAYLSFDMRLSEVMQAH